MKIVRDNKNLYMDIKINGYMIASIAGIETIELKDKMLIYTNTKNGNLNFIHNVKEIKTHIETNDYIHYFIILDENIIRDIKEI